MKQILPVVVIWMLGSFSALPARAEHHPGPTDTTFIVAMLQKSREQILHAGGKGNMIDSSISLTRKAFALSKENHFTRGEGEASLLLSYAFREKKDGPLRERYVQDAITTFRQINDWSGLAEATFLKATYIDYMDSCTLQARIDVENEALDNYIKAGNDLKIAECYEILGDHYILLIDYRNALRVLNKAVDACKKVNNPRLQGVYSNLGQYYYVMGNYEEAVRYGLLAVRAGEALNDSSSLMASIYNRVALNYNAMKDYANAEKYGRKGMGFAIRNKDTAMLYYLLSNVTFSLSRSYHYDEAIAVLHSTEKAYPPGNQGDSFSVTTRYLNIYLDKGRPDQARPYALSLIHMADKPPESLGDYNHWYFSVSRYYLFNKEFNKMFAFMSRFQPQDNMLTADHRLVIYQRKYQADSALGRFRDAFYQHLYYKDLSDSLFSESKSRQIAQLNVQFETESKDKELLLRQKQLQLQDAKLDRSQTYRNFLFYATAGLILVIGLLVSRYRLKTRKNKELTNSQEIINNKNSKLEQLLREKEWLLQEIHHRFKNNLQIIMSLLDSQGSTVKDVDAFDALQDSQARVYSMAMIHQKLYKSPNTLSVDLKDYIADLVNYFHSSYIHQQLVTFRFDLVPMMADMSMAVPLALIINEAVTNSLKYAFVDGRDGIIHVSLAINPAGEVELLMSDNGIGLPQDSDQTRPSSLGISLIRGLAEDMGGKCIIDGINGTSIKVLFAKEKLQGAFRYTS